MDRIDSLISAADTALRTLSGTSYAARPCPVPQGKADPLNEPQRQLAASLMRVNHVGEVCAQALYSSQAMGAQDSSLRGKFALAARDETDHLAWTQRRLGELNARPSLLNPLWYAGAFGIGLLAGRLGDAASLGFVAETERQVERHLSSHLEKLPGNDLASRAIVEQMKADEAGHAADAESAGAARLPAPARWAMRMAARVMTATAHHI